MVDTNKMPLQYGNYFEILIHVIKKTMSVIKHLTFVFEQAAFYSTGNH